MKFNLFIALQSPKQIDFIIIWLMIGRQQKNSAWKSWFYSQRGREKHFSKRLFYQDKRASNDVYFLFACGMSLRVPSEKQRYFLWNLLFTLLFKFIFFWVIFCFPLFFWCELFYLDVLQKSTFTAICSIRGKAVYILVPTAVLRWKLETKNTFAKWKSYIENFLLFPCRILCTPKDFSFSVISFLINKSQTI